jgi:cardiolipin synthase
MATATLANVPQDLTYCLTVAGQELTLYVESPPFLAAILEDIRRAKQRIWLESYIFLDDAAGRAVAAGLCERARAGLDVRVLYDAVGSQTTRASFFRNMELAGVKVHCHHSVWEAFWRFSLLSILNRRNHRKLLVIDNEVAYFGGMNIIDQRSTAPVEKAELMTSSRGWRDLHVRLQGTQQPELAESFERSWRRAHHKKVKRKLLDLRRVFSTDDEESVQFFDSGPGMGSRRAARIFIGLLRQARKRLTLSMAYFVPVGRILREIVRARRRGVFIRVVVPGESDVPIVQRATRSLYAKLLRKRLHIYERQQHMLHGKVMIVDNQWCVLGSANLDARSLWINFELLAVIRSRALARMLNEIIKHDIDRSSRIRLGDVLRQPWWQRQLDRLAWWFRWWL